MNQRWYFDRKRGLAAIRRSPDACDYPTVDEVKAWVTNGAECPRFEDDLSDELKRSLQETRDNPTRRPRS